MMLTLLPEELILVILTAVFSIPDEDFLRTGSRSPCPKGQRSRSATLLVCKTWSRVATPLLYDTVTLRSEAQARALALTLRQYKGDIGGFVKKIRIEGGFGIWVREILKHISEVADLWLSMVLESEDVIGGYFIGFTHINPRRLVVYDEPSQGVDTRKLELTNALCEAIQFHWTSLRTIHLRENSSIDEFGMWSRFRRISEALQAGGQTISCFCIDQTLHMPEALVEFINSPSVVEVHISSLVPRPLFDDLPTALDGSPRRTGTITDILGGNRQLYNKVVWKITGSSTSMSMD